MKTDKCTLGFPKNDVKKSGGILVFLLKNGVKTLTKLNLSILQSTAIASGHTENTKYGYVNKYITKIYKNRIRTDVDLADFINDLVTYGLDSNRHPNLIEFKDNEHLFELHKKGRDNYVVKRIDGIHVAQSFTKDQMMDIYYKSIFERVGALFCKITKTITQGFDLNCTPMNEEETEELLSKNTKEDN